MSYSRYSPSKSSTPVVLNLIIINALIFVAQIAFDGSTGWLTNRLVLWGTGTPFFEPYQLVSSMFAHATFFHILFNMYALWLFGAVLERQWGPVKFLIFYLVCGLAAGLAHLLLVPMGAALGASGAVMGLLAAFAFTYPNVQFFIIPIPFPIKAKWLAIGYAAIDLFGGITGGGGIAHFAHLGGMVMGVILMLMWRKNNHSNLP